MPMIKSLESTSAPSLLLKYCPGIINLGENKISLYGRENHATKNKDFSKDDTLFSGSHKSSATGLRIHIAMRAPGSTFKLMWGVTYTDTRDPDSLRASHAEFGFMFRQKLGIVVEVMFNKVMMEQS